MALRRASSPSLSRWGRRSAALTIDAKGDIFGTTISGGANDDGTVFEIEKTATGYVSAAATLASFTSADGQSVSKSPQNPDRRRQWRPVWNHGPEYPAWREYGGGGVRDREDTHRLQQHADHCGQRSRERRVWRQFGGGRERQPFPGPTQTGGANSKGTAFEITGSGFATTPTITPIISNILWQKTGWAGRVLGNGRDQGSTLRSRPDSGPGWSAIGTGDFNGDGHSDILWQNANGQAAIWE